MILTATDRVPVLILLKRQVLPPPKNRYEITSLDSSKSSACLRLLHNFLLKIEGALLSKPQAFHCTMIVQSVAIRLMPGY
jgi:hypothetical protein